MSRTAWVQTRFIYLFLFVICFRNLQPVLICVTSARRRGKLEGGVGRRKAVGMTGIIEPVSHTTTAFTGIY